jgi:hypothetical protein
MLSSILPSCKCTNSAQVHTEPSMMRVMRYQVPSTKVTNDTNMLITMPSTGARKMKAMILRMVALSTTSATERPPCVVKACVRAAPAKPPINVCELLLGMPYHQVSRFQTMAAIRPLRMTGRVMNCSCTVLLMVLATAWSLKMKKATKLNRAAHTTA